MELTGANFYFCVDTIVEILGPTSAALQIPIGAKGESYVDFNTTFNAIAKASTR